MNNTIAYKRTQLPQNALFIGIDPHKRKHAVSINTANAQVLSKFMISNNRTGFEELLTRCEQVRQRAGAATVVFAIEPGAHYWRTLAYYLDQQQHCVRLINPFTLKRQRDGEDLLRRKSDYRDASMAGQLAAEGKYTWSQLPKERYAELRYAHETYQQCVEEESRTRLQLQCALDELFPEFHQVFKDLNGITARFILQYGVDPHQIAERSAAGWLAQVSAAFGGKRLQRQKLLRLHDLAQRSIGVPHGCDALVRRVRLLSQRLNHLAEQRQAAEADLVGCFEALPEGKWLLTIRGLGVLNAAGLLAHVGDIGQYSTVKQLAKLAGVIPVENESAGRSANRTPMSKKGRRGLPAVSFRAVASLLRHNPGFRQYVDRLEKRPAGQNPLNRREAIGAAMNKLLRLVYALLSKQQAFDEQILLGA